MRKLSLDPIYHAIMNRILTGSLAEGTRLPSERELAVQYGLARNTLRMVLKRLEEEGFLERHRRTGTVVCRPHSQEVIYFMLPCPDFLEAHHADHSAGSIRLLSKVSAAAHERGASLRLLYATDDNVYGHVNLKNLECLQPGSCVILNSTWYLPVIPLLLERGVRVIFISHTTEKEKQAQLELYAGHCHFLMMDYRQEAYDLYGYLHKQGARRIGLAGPFLEAGYPVTQAFQDAVEEWGGDGHLVFNMLPDCPLGEETMVMNREFIRQCLKDDADLDALMVMGNCLDDGNWKLLLDAGDVPAGVKMGFLTGFPDMKKPEKGIVVGHASTTQVARRAVDVLLAPSWQPGVEFFPYQFIEQP